MAKKQKKYVQRDGFRELNFGFMRIEDRRTEKDVRKRMIQKRLTKHNGANGK